MLARSDLPSKEIISLRYWGHKIARFNELPFLLRGSNDNQLVFYGNTVKISIDQFRLLPAYFLNKASYIYSKLILG